MNDVIGTALATAGVSGFTGTYDSLGGGEMNDTYLLYCTDRRLIIRIAKDVEQTTLMQEAKALRLYDNERIPALVYFDEHARINGRLWILESYVPGATVKHLSLEQFYTLGSLLADVHKQTADGSKIALRGQFIDSCKAFGGEQFLLHHPDPTLQALIRAMFREFEALQPMYDTVVPALIHADATPSNILVNGDEVGLIDWEFSRFSDPMCDFSTVYYEDMEYNRGKWRMRIAADEKRALFNGYTSAGGKIYEERIRFWIRLDKLGAAVFLYWRLHQSRRPTPGPDLEQYKLDYTNLLASLSV